MGKKLITGFFCSLVLFAVGCTQGHCRRKTEVLQTAEPVGAPEKAGSTKPLNSDRVLVYKYDGSLQCSMGKPISPDTMSKELSGIAIFSASKKRDGLMHIQACGSITGMANVFEIPAEELKRAESKGFKKWNFE